MSAEDNGDTVYPLFPTHDAYDTHWDEWSLTEREQFLDSVGILEKYDWDNQDGPTRQQILEGYTESTYQADTADGTIDADWVWGQEADDDLEPTVDREAILDEFDIDLEIDQLFVEDVIELVGGNAFQVSVAGIEIPGVIGYTMRGRGMESQYLREIAGGGDGEADTVWEPPPGMQPPEEEEDAPEGGEEPPLEIGFEVYSGQEVAQALSDLRTEDELFEVVVGPEVFEDMEMSNFERELTGKNPYAYKCMVEVREWREVEVDLDDGADGGASEWEEIDPSEIVDDWEESGTPDEPNEITVPAGESRTIDLEQESMSNVDFVIEDGGSLTINASGDNWDISNVGISGEEGAANITATGGGTIRFLHIPGGEDAIQIDSDDVELENINATNSPLKRAITAVAGGAVQPEIDTEFYSPATTPPSEFETVVVGANETKTVRVETGEVHESVLYDCTATDAHVRFECSGRNWVLRNVGIAGERGSTGAYIRAADDGGTSVIENVYLGDGGERKKGIGIFVGDDHTGHLEIERVFIKESPETSVDATSISAAGGSIRLRNCYSVDALGRHYAVAGGMIENCVTHNSPEIEDIAGDSIVAKPPHIFRGELGLKSSNAPDAHSVIWGSATGTVAGEVYKARIEFEQSAETTMGLLFGAQGGGWDDYSGYAFVFDSVDNVIRLGRYDGGEAVNVEEEAFTIPTSTELIVEIDYRSSSSSVIQVKVIDGETTTTVSIADTAYDVGAHGFYRFHGDAGWTVHGYQYVDITTVHNCHLGTGEVARSIVAGDGESRAVVAVRFTQLLGDIEPKSGSEIHMVGEFNDANPINFIPLGCPRNAEEAASGVGATEGGPLPGEL